MCGCRSGPAWWIRPIVFALYPNRGRITRDPLYYARIQFSFESGFATLRRSKLAKCDEHTALADVRTRMTTAQSMGDHFSALHRRRHGFEVGGTNSRRKFFLSCPQICVVPPPNSGGTAGAYHSGKTDIVKIRVKKQGNVDLATSWYSRCFAEYTTRNLKQKVYILWRRVPAPENLKKIKVFQGLFIQYFIANSRPSSSRSFCSIQHYWYLRKQEAQLMLTTCATRLAVSQGHQT